jgi:hypothetical protein
LQNVLSDLRKIGCQLLTSLTLLRAAGVTHADLKLENVLMSRPCSAQPGKGTSEPGSSQGWGSVGVKLADFGNAFGELDHDEEVRGRVYSVNFINLWERRLYYPFTKGKGYKENGRRVYGDYAGRKRGRSLSKGSNAQVGV